MENYLTIVSDPIKGGANTGRLVMAKCICGSLKLYRSRFIKNNHTTSCGCKLKTHGLTHHPLFKVWQSMKERCYNKNHTGYKYYGARGITICDLWLNNPEIFINWGISNGYEKGLQLDREKNDGNYEPNNCRFVTRKVNMNNRRKPINCK